jgi:hypothetical protein
MDIDFYLNKFQAAAEMLDKKVLAKKQIEVAVGKYRQNAVFLKLYKKSWANEFENPHTSESRIFFSVWINGSTIHKEKLFYNIHALKLRKLKGHAIESRKFAATFRASFRIFEHRWKNVSTNFGPLTLMEGWIKIDPKKFQKETVVLAKRFFEIEHLLDNNLALYKK